MTELRELTDAELDIVGGGTSNQCGGGGSTMNPGSGGGIKLVEEIIVDILKIFEPQKQKVAYF